MPPRKRIDNAEHSGETIKVGDHVLVRADRADRAATEVFEVAKPFVARVASMYETHRKTVKLLVNWYYRPEDPLTGGRQPWHGKQELFSSGHHDTISINTVLKKCRVMDLSTYLDMPEYPRPDDFYTRFHFDHEHQLFQPPKVPVFCQCEQPYNPDRFMVVCCSCSDWYHPECLPPGAVPECESLDQLEHWTCPDCCQQALKVQQQQQQLQHAPQQPDDLRQDQQQQQQCALPEPFNDPKVDLQSQLADQRDLLKQQSTQALKHQGSSKPLAVEQHMVQLQAATLLDLLQQSGQDCKQQQQQRDQQPRRAVQHIQHKQQQHDTQQQHIDSKPQQQALGVGQQLTPAAVDDDAHLLATLLPDDT